MFNSVLRTLVLLGSLVITSLIPALFPPNVSGVWHIEVQNEAASEQLTVNIQQNKSVITGSYVGSYQISDIVGVFDGKEIMFEYLIDGVRVMYVGHLKGRTLSGTYHAGSFDNGDFVGKRVVAADS